MRSGPRDLRGIPSTGAAPRTCAGEKGGEGRVNSGRMRFSMARPRSLAGRFHKESDTAGPGSAAVEVADQILNFIPVLPGDDVAGRTKAAHAGPLATERLSLKHEKAEHREG